MEDDCAICTFVKQVDKGKTCANLDCPGFVQQSKQVFPGFKITPVSTVGGQQSYLHVKVFKVIIIINAMKNLMVLHF
jgi:hypothetical protein